MKKRKPFSKFLRENVKLVNIEILPVEIDKIHCQYNYDRFKLYREVVRKGCNYNEILNISESPHCDLLRNYIDNKEKVFDNIKKSMYYRMHKLYGKNHKWTINKIKTFFNLYEDIKKRGFIGEIVLINKPVVENKYNDGYEIYEGHHRTSCCYMLGLDTVNSQLVRTDIV
jgi:hypothetical protein